MELSRSVDINVIRHAIEDEGCEHLACPDCDGCVMCTYPHKCCCGRCGPVCSHDHAAASGSCYHMDAILHVA